MNDDREVNKISDYLEGKKIALLISGGIAAYKSPSLIRHFRHYGAQVYPYLTSEALKFVTLDAIEWNSINPAVMKLSSNSEHLYQMDAYVIAPATYDVIGKFANGIADDAVSTTLASALGRLENGKTKILIAPAMHSTMTNSIYQENLEKLLTKGVKEIQPVYKNGKANLAETHDIIVETIRELSTSPLKGKNVLVTAGPTPGKIDDVRMITNKFKGTLGIKIAEEAYLNGANVKLIIGSNGNEPPKYLETIKIHSFEEYYSSVMQTLENKIDIGVFSAAVADYIPKEVIKGKIPSQGALKCIELKETPKVIKEVRARHPGLYMVTFKYESGITSERLEEIARNRISQGYQLIVANREEDMNDKTQKAIIVDKTGIIAEPKTKNEISRTLIKILEREVNV